MLQPWLERLEDLKVSPLSDREALREKIMNQMTENDSATMSVFMDRFVALRDNSEMCFKQNSKFIEILFSDLNERSVNINILKNLVEALKFQHRRSLVPNLKWETVLSLYQSVLEETIEFDKNLKNHILDCLIDLMKWVIKICPNPQTLFPNLEKMLPNARWIRLSKNLELTMKMISYQTQISDSFINFCDTLLETNYALFLLPIVCKLKNPELQRMVPRLVQIALDYVLSDATDQQDFPGLISLFAKLIYNDPRTLLILSARSQHVLLPSLSMKNKWPLRLADLHVELVRNTFKKNSSSKTLEIFLPGLLNVVNHVYAGGSNPALAAKYVLVYSYIASVDSESVLAKATNSLEDPHKGSAHPFIFLTGIAPLLPNTAHSVSLIEFVMEYCLESIDTTNLLKTTAGLSLLNFLFTNVPHGLTLRDLSSENESLIPEIPSEIPYLFPAIPSSSLLSLSTSFPDWTCMFLERILSVSLTLGGKSEGAILSSEGMERTIRELIISTWVWVSNNSDSQSRHLEIFQEFIQSNSSMNKHACSLIGKLLAHNPNDEMISWLLKRIQQTSSPVLIKLLSHSVRFQGTKLIPHIPKLVDVVNTHSVKHPKPVAKLVQRIAEAMLCMYPIDLKSWPKKNFNSNAFLLSHHNIPWWTLPDQEIEWHVPSANEGKLVLELSLNPNFPLRPILYAASSSPLEWVRTTLFAQIKPLSSTATVKETSVWLKLVASLRGHRVGNKNESLVTKFGGQNLGKFSFIYGKKYSLLDQSRFHFIRNIQLSVVPSESHINEIESIIPQLIEIALKTKFEKIRFRTVSTVKEFLSFIGISIQVSKEISKQIIETTTPVVAAGLGLLVNYCPSLRWGLLNDSELLVSWFEFLKIQISIAQDSDRDSLIGTIRDIWSSRFEVDRKKFGSASFIESTLTSIASNQFWKLQASWLAMAFIVWDRTSSDRGEVASELSRILCFMDATPLPLSVSLILVAWIQRLLEEGIEVENLDRVVKIFCLQKRFEKLNETDSIYTLAKNIDANRKTGWSLKTSGIIASNAVFWSLVSEKKFLGTCVFDDEDSHCAGLEIIAGGCWDEEFINNEIIRSDGVLLPTISGALRMYFVEPKISGGNFDIEKLKKVFHSFSRNNWRYRLVIYNAICSDQEYVSSIIPEIDPSIFMQFDSMQIMEYNSSIVANLVYAGCNGDDKPSSNDLNANLFLLKIDSKVLKLSRKPSNLSVTLFRTALETIDNSAKEDVRNEAAKYLNIAAEFISVSQIDIPTLRTPKARETLLECITTMIIKDSHRGDIWSAPIDQTDNVFRTSLITPFETILTSGPLEVNETSDAGWLKACKECMAKILLVCPQSVINLIIPQADVVCLCAVVAVASLSHEVPQYGISAVSRLGMFNVKSVSMKKLTEITLSDFFKGLANKGILQETEKRFTSDVLDVIHAGKAKHSYIS